MIQNISYLEEQDLELWCWASCSQSILQYINNIDSSQCEIANSAFPAIDCCTDWKECHRSLDTQEMNSLHNKLNIIFKIGGSLAINKIIDEIGNNKNVIIAGYRMYKESPYGHLLLLSGIDTNNGPSKIYAMDPRYIFGWHSYNDIKNNGYGSWVQTWVIKK